MKYFSLFGLGICLMALSLNNYGVMGFPGSRKVQHGHRHQEHQQMASSCGPDDWYHKETTKCYPIRTVGQGPCGVDMVFVADRRNPGHGVCQCVDHIGCQYWPFTYWPDEKRCYRLFERGPCNENEWLVDHHNNNRDSDRSHRKNEGGGGGERPIHGMCRTMPHDCREDSYSNPLMKFSHKGKCYHVGTKGFCKNPDHKMYFTQGDAQPRCSSQPDRVMMNGADIGCSNSGPAFVPPPPPPSSGPGPVSGSVLAPEDIRNGGQLPPQKLIILPPPSSSTSSGPMIVSPPPGPTLTLIEISSSPPPPLPLSSTTVAPPTIVNVTVTTQQKTLSQVGKLPCPKGTTGVAGSCQELAFI